ncbi:hypothetical protein CONCODRAFT_13816 [Conidiobolus coronatus NRRL 28638]|uniref:Transcription factor domain-containing protein n=1 Tax=Conidiobolus coronatus (strain ATCC 28846 / CBS 209.66 / NRRL 28638) TaxID=796925 RepID=A0A137NQ12_CONC2|nr:hypothetical protein CONCODRAFT_13816 [Conidiobolus coronatus NRRL 28638]|eukprot:KXN64845.1 hypothetical protein CONCODRAFT_13816 [Conidiobolus coronatus NRRL 28638]
MGETKKLIELKFCFSCKVKVVKPGNQYCKACKIPGSKKVKFYSYNIGSDNNKVVKLSKGKIVFDIEPSLPKLNFIYYHTPQEVNILQKLNFQRFRNIGELASFIFSSRQIPIFQLVFNFCRDLMLLPQIRGIVSENKRFIPNEDVEANMRNIKEVRTKATWLSLVYNEEFWEELILLYLTNHHICCAFFHLKDLQANKISRPLITAIYYMGYLCRQDNPDELTNYMKTLAKNQFKKILFKPSLQNIQALCIYFYIFLKDDARFARAILAQITRMCYSIGAHIDTDMFSDCTNYNRKTIIRKVAYLNKNISGCLKIKPNYLLDIPNFDSSLYEPHWHLLDYKFKLKNFDVEERLVLSKATVIHNRFRDSALIPTSFTNLSTKPENVAELCLIKLDKLSLAFSAIKNSYSELIEIYPNSELIIEDMKVLAPKRSN